MTITECRADAPFREFLKLKKDLMEERAGLVERINQINAVLEAREFYFSNSGTVRIKRQGKSSGPRNKLTLRDAVLKITRKQAMTKEQILLELEKIGYEFATPRPINSLNTVLYAKSYFHNDNGSFRPVDALLSELNNSF